MKILRRYCKTLDLVLSIKYWRTGFIWLLMGRWNSIFQKESLGTRLCVIYMMYDILVILELKGLLTDWKENSICLHWRRMWRSMWRPVVNVKGTIRELRRSRNIIAFGSIYVEVGDQLCDGIVRPQNSVPHSRGSSWLPTASRSTLWAWSRFSIVVNHPKSSLQPSTSPPRNSSHTLVQVSYGH